MSDAVNMQAPILVLGAESITLPPISMAMAKRMAPLLAEMRVGQPPIETRDLVGQILAIFLGLDGATFDDRCTYREMTVILSQWEEILNWVGLETRAPEPGEAEAADLQPAA